MATWTNACNDARLPVQAGVNTFRIQFQHLQLLPGRYFISMALSSGRGVDDWIHEAVTFEITSSPEFGKD